MEHAAEPTQPEQLPFSARPSRSRFWADPPAPAQPAANGSGADTVTRLTAVGLPVGPCSLPTGISEADVLTAAQDRKVALTRLAPFWHGTSQRTQGIVVGYGTPAEHEYATALRHLGQLMRTAAKG